MEKWLKELYDWSYNKTIQSLKGGEGSGNFGHAGRPGEVGGSAPSNSASHDSDFNGIRKSLADEFNFPENRIIITKQKGEIFKVGEAEEFNAAGVYDHSNGTITIYDAENENAIREVFSHEVAHANFDNKDTNSVLDDNLLSSLSEDDGITQYSRDWWEKVNTAPDEHIARMYKKFAVNETIAEISRWESQDYLRELNLSSEWSDIYKFVMGRPYRQKE